MSGDAQTQRASGTAAGGAGRLRNRFAMLVARPYVAAELPGWGHVYRTLVGDWRRNGDWAGFPPQIFRNKINGCWFVADLSQWSDRSAYFLRRWYDLKLIRTLKALVGPGDTVVDVGANYGHFAVAAAALVGPSGRVLAFEPNPRAMARLRVNADLNNIWWIDARDAALGEAPGTATLHIPRVNSGEATLGRSVYDPATVSEVEIRVERGDAALAGLRPRFIKIDVEGFETRTIAGLSGVIASARPVLTTEIVGRHLKNAGDSPEMLIAAMEGAGYVPFRMTQAGRGAPIFRPFRLAEGDGDALWAPREKVAEIRAQLVASGISVEEH